MKAKALMSFALIWSVMWEIVCCEKWCLLSEVCCMRKKTQILWSVTPDELHLLAQSTGGKSRSKNGHLVMAMWHMKCLLLCVRQSESRDGRVRPSGHIFFFCNSPWIFKRLCNSMKSCECRLTHLAVTAHAGSLIKAVRQLRVVTASWGVNVIK